MANPADDLDLTMTGELSDGAIEALAALLVEAAAADETFTPPAQTPALAANE